MRRLLKTIFFFVISGLCVLTKTVDEKPAAKTVYHIKNALVPLLASRSVEKAAQLIGTLSFDQQLSLVTTIIADNASPLTRNDKCELIFALGLQYSQDKDKQQKMFHLLQDPSIKYGAPILFVAVQGIYASLIRALIEWAESVSGIFMQTMVMSTLTYVIDNNAVEAIKKLFNNGLAVKTKQAQELLWRVVDGNRNAQFILFLARIAGGVNTVHFNKWTLLTRAVSLNNYDMVAALLEAGARVNQIIDPRIGSALQIAIEKRYADIEMLLRKYGARE